MYDKEIADCRRRMALGVTLNALLNNPDYKTIITEGFLRDAVIQRGLNINADKSGTIQFLKGAATFNAYVESVRRDAEQASIDLNGYLNLST